MISLDQVFLLEQKVESAVAKIQQLQAENDALRNKCEQLTNALSAKSEQLSTFENDQTQIESGIKKALDRLNLIENSVLKAATQLNAGGQAPNPAPVQPEQPKVHPEPIRIQTTVEPQVQPAFTQPVQNTIQPEISPSFDEPVQNEPEAVQNTPSMFDEPETTSVTSDSFEPTESFQTQTSISETVSSVQDEINFDSMDPSAEPEDTTDGLGFDIF